MSLSNRKINIMKRKVQGQRSFYSRFSCQEKRIKAKPSRTMRRGSTRRLCRVRFAKAQIKLSKGSSKRIFRSGLLANKVRCSCGAWYEKKIWHSTDERYKKRVYRCNYMFKVEKCSSPVISEDELKAIVVKAISQLYVR